MYFFRLSFKNDSESDSRAINPSMASIAISLFIVFKFAMTISDTFKPALSGKRTCADLDFLDFCIFKLTKRFVSFHGQKNS
jgi:hypothetical protein